MRPAMAPSPRRCHVRTANAPPEARGLIEALAVRYPQTEVPDDGVLASWERAYADAMIPVYEAYGDDPDIAALYIDSQIMLTPWQIYDVDRRAPNPEARETVSYTHLTLPTKLSV